MKELGNKLSWVLALLMVVILAWAAVYSENNVDRIREDAKTAEVESATLEVEATEPATEVASEEVDTGFVTVGDKQFVSGYTAEATDNTVTPGDDVASEYSIIINEENGQIVAEKNAKTIISPASMTKILTVLVAAEHVENLDDVVTITHEETDFCFVNDCSNVGFVEGDQVTVRDLFYGTILPSGADAALALASYVAGSHEAFVDMMNEKLLELGLSETAHFTNCIGIYNEDHYCTVYDMAMIMKAAVQNDFCREVLSTHVYTIEPSENHEDGIVLSNWFLRRIEDHMEGGEVIGAKTGYVAQSGSCAASYGVSASGVPYVCVTGKSYSSWGCIYDHVAMFGKYAK